MAHVISLGLIITFVTISVSALLRWIRTKSPAARERARFKSALPLWVKYIEMMVWVAFWVAIFFVIFFGSLSMHHSLRPITTKPGSPAIGLICFASLFAGMVPAMLSANLLSWLILPLRRANLLAMEGLPAASFAEMNRGLIKFGLVLEPLCLAALVLGIW